MLPFPGMTTIAGALLTPAIRSRQLVPIPRAPSPANEVLHGSLGTILMPEIVALPLNKRMACTFAASPRSGNDEPIRSIHCGSGRVMRGSSRP